MAHVHAPSQDALVYVAAPATVPYAPTAQGADVGDGDMAGHQYPATPHGAGNADPPAQKNVAGQPWPPPELEPAPQANPGTLVHATG